MFFGYIIGKSVRAAELSSELPIASLFRIKRLTAFKVKR